MIQKGQIGLYIHWPFCLAKCPYCDFNSFVNNRIDHDEWANAYLNALDHYAAQLPGRIVRSVFFGGGTPSLMKPKTVEMILERIHKHWRSVNDLEVTLEANPTSVEAEKFQAFRAAGVNRVSLGVQSLNDSALKFLGRQHSANEAIKAIELAQQNFERYSFDLIYARPEQTLVQWEEELRRALKYTRGHMSLYQLTIEQRTPFFMAHKRGDFIMPREELAADFYMLTQDIMSDAKLPLYEVSNHAAPGQESQHNLIYWHYGDYVGVGPGAHGRLTLDKSQGAGALENKTHNDAQKYATYEHNIPNVWLKHAGENGDAAKPYEAVSAQDQFMEALMMGLRLTSGLSKQHLERITSLSFEAQINRDKLETVKAEGWMIEEGDQIALSAEGILRLNAILPFILRDERLKAA